jgi:hypothetical protein
LLAHRIKRDSDRVWRGFWDEERERVQADSIRALCAAQARRMAGGAATRYSGEQLWAEQSEREGEDGGSGELHYLGAKLCSGSSTTGARRSNGATRSSELGLVNGGGARVLRGLGGG